METIRKRLDQAGFVLMIIVVTPLLVLLGLSWWAYYIRQRKLRGVHHAFNKHIAYKALDTTCAYETLSQCSCGAIAMWRRDGWCWDHYESVMAEIMLPGMYIAYTGVAKADKLCGIVGRYLDKPLIEILQYAVSRLPRCYR